MLPPGPKLQQEVKPSSELVYPSAGGWCSRAAGACTAGRLVVATELAVLTAILTHALQGLYGDMHRL